jgi:hypothetical protein
MFGGNRLRRVLWVLIVNVLLCVPIVLAAWLAYHFLIAPRRTQPTPPAPPKVAAEEHEYVCRDDPRLGFALIPGSVLPYHHMNGDLSTAQIDATGHRVTPDPANPKGRIIILGCSFTFGDLVNDDENFPYLLGRDYWTDYKVVDRAFSAYGTGQAYIGMEDELAASPPPALILYGYLGYHQQRNYLDKDWLGMLWYGHRKNPLFEVENGQVVFKGLVSVEQGRIRDDALIAREKEITTALLLSMTARCKEKGVPFIVMLLHDPWKKNPYYDELTRMGVPLIDLREVSHDFLGGGHPNPTWHRKMADAIGKSELINNALRGKSPS